MAVQLQWDLSQSSTSVIGVAAGVLRAATTDNVQPLAIMACEQFGSTLAMSPDTVRKIEHTVVPTPQPAVLAFLKSTVGYSVNDCVSHFCKNVAGLQFLALAATIVTSTDSLQGAAAIQAMLASTAKDKTLLPTTRQMKSRAGWEVLLRPRYPRGEPYPNKYRYLNHEPAGSLFPDYQSIGNLVDALRQLRRIGDVGITKVMVRTSWYGPWIIAFIKWSLGYPPSVFRKDGTAILEQARSEVIVILDDRFPSNDAEITIHSSIRGPSSLVGSGSDQMVAGMVNLRTYGDLLLRHHDFHTGIRAKAFFESIPYALRLIVETTDFDLEPRKKIKGGAKLSPFPEDSIISRMHNLLFGKEMKLCSLPTGSRLTQLPSVALYMKSLGRCTCARCRTGGFLTSKFLGPNHTTECVSGEFLCALGKVSADVLALSLFDCPELLRVSSAPTHPEVYDRDTFVRYVSESLGNGVSGTCGPENIMDRALQLVGHDMGARVERKRWVLSSSKGQTVWPTVYENHAYRKRGSLLLSWFPGLIVRNGDLYARAVDPPRRGYAKDTITQKCEKVVGPRNLCPNLGLEWSVSSNKLMIADAQYSGRRWLRRTSFSRSCKQNGRSSNCTPKVCLFSLLPENLPGERHHRSYFVNGIRDQGGL